MVEGDIGVYGIVKTGLGRARKESMAVRKTTLLGQLMRNVVKVSAIMAGLEARGRQVDQKRKMMSFTDEMSGKEGWGPA